MSKKYLIIIYLATWLGLFGISMARYFSIWNNSCPFQTIGWLACSPQLTDVAKFSVGFLYIFVFSIFLLAARWLWKNYNEIYSVPAWIKRSFFALAVLSVFVVPFSANDLPYYFSAGETVSKGINLYVADWIHHVDFASPVIKNPLIGFSYGPLIASSFAGLYWLSGGQVLIFMFLWKLLMLLTMVLCGVLTMKLTKLFSNNNQESTSWVFWLAQPLLLFEWVVNGHFDGLWILFVLLAIYAAKKDKWWMVLPFLAIGMWIKYIPVLLTPFFLLWWWQKLGKQTWKKLTIQMGAGAVLTALITVFSWWPFWTGPQVFSSVVVQSKWAVNSVFATLYYALQPLFEKIFGLQAHFYLTRLTQGILLLALVYMLYPFIKKGLSILFKCGQWEDGEYVQAMLIFLLVYLIVWQKSFWPWYGTWFISLGLIAYYAKRNSTLFKIIAWMSSIPLIQHIILLTDSISGNPKAGSTLGFYASVTIIVLVYPLYLLFRWRQKNYSADEIIENKN
jgi:hypothetical protein